MLHRQANPLGTVRCLLLMTALLSAVAIVGCTVADSDAAAERTSAVTSPILNAYNVADDAVDGVPELTRRDTGNACSGVLLTNQWILTAAHCAVKVWPTDRAPMANTDLSLQLGTQFRENAAEIRIHPTLDAALVRVSTPFPMNGGWWGYLRPLDASPRETLLGYYVRCLGYGSRAIGMHMGALGTADLQVGLVSANGFTVQPNASDQALWYGDSGGPCLRYDNGALVGIAANLHSFPGPGEIVGTDETAIWALRDWIGTVYQPSDFYEPSDFSIVPSRSALSLVRGGEGNESSAPVAFVTATTSGLPSQLTVSFPDLPAGISLNSVQTPWQFARCGGTSCSISVASGDTIQLSYTSSGPVTPTPSATTSMTVIATNGTNTHSFPMSLTTNPCVPHSRAEACAGKQCGHSTDGCWVGLDCGGCDQFSTCQDNQCVVRLHCPPGWVQCDDTSCAPAAKQCAIPFP